MNVIFFQSEKATNKSLEGIDYVARKLLDYQIIGDSPSHVTSGLMTLTVSRQCPRDISDAALNSGLVVFRIPSELKHVKLDGFDVVNTKVCLFQVKRLQISESPVNCCKMPRETFNSGSLWQALRKLPIVLECYSIGFFFCLRWLACRKAPLFQAVLSPWIHQSRLWSSWKPRERK